MSDESIRGVLLAIEALSARVDEGFAAQAKVLAHLDEQVDNIHEDLREIRERPPSLEHSTGNLLIAGGHDQAADAARNRRVDRLEERIRELERRKPGPA